MDEGRHLARRPRRCGRQRAAAVEDKRGHRATRCSMSGSFATRAGAGPRARPDRPVRRARSRPRPRLPRRASAQAARGSRRGVGAGGADRQCGFRAPIPLGPSRQIAEQSAGADRLRRAHRARPALDRRARVGDGDHRSKPRRRFSADDISLTSPVARGGGGDQVEVVASVTKARAIGAGAHTTFGHPPPSPGMNRRVVRKDRRQPGGRGSGAASRGAASSSE